MPGQNFNLFIKYKNYFPEELRNHIRTARLFCFDLLPTEALDHVPYEEMGDLAYNLCLPFPVVAVEDKVSCVIMWDLEKGVIGSDQERGYMEVSTLDSYLQEGAYKIDTRNDAITPEEDAETREKARQHFAVYGDYPAMVRWGKIKAEWVAEINKWKSSGIVEGTLFINPDNRILDVIKAEGYDRANRDMVRGGVTAIEELIRLSSLKTFLLEQAPRKITKNRYALSHERPIYTALRPERIRKIMRLKSIENCSTGKEIKERRAHVRREHERTLQSEKFIHKQGQVIEVKRAYIPAIWQGESQADVGQHHYRVILDLPKDFQQSIKEKRNDK